jgi:hypothetical protein
VSSRHQGGGPGSAETGVYGVDGYRVMAKRCRDWRRQAEADLRHAHHARDDADYN